MLRMSLVKPSLTDWPAELESISAPASAQAQPIPMDMSGDLKIDLFGTIPSASRDGEFKVWQNVWNASQPTSMFNLYVACLLMYIEK